MKEYAEMRQERKKERKKERKQSWKVDQRWNSSVRDADYKSTV